MVSRSHQEPEGKGGFWGGLGVEPVLDDLSVDFSLVCEASDQTS